MMERKGFGQQAFLKRIEDVHLQASLFLKSGAKAILFTAASIKIPTLKILAGSFSTCTLTLRIANHT